MRSFDRRRWSFCRMAAVGAVVMQACGRGTGLHFSPMQKMGQLVAIRCVFVPPRLKIKIRKDRPLDTVANKEKALKPILALRDTMLKFKKATVPFKLILGLRRRLDLKRSDDKIEYMMRRHPNIFEFYEHPKDKQLWCRLAPDLLDLMKEERQIYKQQEPFVVAKLQRLLMLATDHRIAVEKLKLGARFFGLPEDFASSILPNYPQHFRLVRVKRAHFLELAAWNKSLAVSKMEKAAKKIAKEKGLGDIETNGRPLAFKLQYSPGTQLKKKIKSSIQEWQKLPYISPYQNTAWVEEDTPLHDRMLAALLHEVLSLTIEKKILLEVIVEFQNEFRLPQKVAKAFNRFPGVFYVSLKGGFHTIFLREAYKRKKLIAEHPLISLKFKYYRMLINGPRLRAMGIGSSSSAAKDNALDKLVDQGLEEDNESQSDLEEGYIDDEAPSSDLDESHEDPEFSDSEDLVTRGGLTNGMITSSACRPASDECA